MRQKILPVSGIILSLLLLAGVFYRVRLPAFWAALKGTDPGALALAIFFFAVSCGVRAAIWSLTTGQLKKVTLGVLFGGVIVGYMANNLLPARAGEVIRAYYLSRRTGIPGPAAFATVCIERLLDAASLGLLMLGALVIGVKGLNPRTAQLTLGVFLAVLAVAAAVFGALLRLTKRSPDKPLLPGFIRNLLTSFTGPLQPLREPRWLALLAILNLLAWGANYLSFLVLLPAVQERHQAALLLLLFVNTGLLVPSSPGAFGVMQLAFWMALAPFGVKKEAALALSLAYQGGLYLFTLVVGLPYYVRAHVDYGNTPAAPRDQDTGGPSTIPGCKVAVAPPASRKR